MKKSKKIPLVTDAMPGDIVKVKRAYTDGMVVEVTGACQEIAADPFGDDRLVVIANGVHYFVDPDNVTEGTRRSRKLALVHTESITREWEVPDIPTEWGALIWTKVADDGPATRRMLVQHTGSPAWWGKKGFIYSGDIVWWQPVTPQTLENPEHDKWITR